MVFTSIKSFIRFQKPLFAVFIMLQVLALVFTQYAFLGNEKQQNDRLIYVENATLFTVEFENDTVISDISDAVESLAGYNPEDLAAVSVDIFNGNLRAYYFGQNKVVNYGTEFSSVDEVIASTDSEISSSAELNGISVFNGRTFKVVGMRTNVAYNEIPIDAVDDTFYINRINVVFSHLPKQSEKVNFTKYLQTLFPSASIAEPAPRSAETEQRLSSQLLLTVALSFLTVVNILFIFRYVLTKRKKTYIIARLCGATKLKVFVLTLSEYLIYTLFSVCAATVLSKYVTVPLLFGNAHCSAASFVIPAIAFPALCSVIIIPVLIKNCNADLSDKRWE